MAAIVTVDGTMRSSNISSSSFRSSRLWLLIVRVRELRPKKAFKRFDNMMMSFQLGAKDQTIIGNDLSVLVRRSVQVSNGLDNCFRLRNASVDRATDSQDEWSRSWVNYYVATF